MDRNTFAQLEKLAKIADTAGLTKAHVWLLSELLNAELDPIELTPDEIHHLQLGIQCLEQREDSGRHRKAGTYYSDVIKSLMTRTNLTTQQATDTVNLYLGVK